jgi:putative ABC transport system ATP-binding protein
MDAREAPTLEARNLSRSIGGRVLVSDIGLQVKPGEVLAVVGPSGAGKSSFLRLLNRLDEPTGGTVFLDGHDYHAIPLRELRRRVGMVMQAAYLFPGTVAANIDFGPRQRGEQLSGEQIANLLERVGLPGYQARDVSNLSGGEAQRVSVARAGERSGGATSRRADIGSRRGFGARRRTTGARHRPRAAHGVCDCHP